MQFKLVKMLKKPIPLILFCVLLATLLIGQRFGFIWAGGEGYEPNLPVRNVHSGAEYARGEAIETTDSPTLLAIGKDTLVALDVNTTITLNTLKEEQIVIRFPRGRIYIDREEALGTFHVRTNYHESVFSMGRASFVNYDFREIVSVIPINTNIQTFTELNETTVDTQIPIDIHETEPVERTNFDFLIDQGTGAEFYAWALEEIHTQNIAP